MSRRLTVESRGDPARLLLLGGEPLGVEIKMWWNFVARTLDEITDAWRAWRCHDDDRFGLVASRPCSHRCSVSSLARVPELNNGSEDDERMK